MSAQQKVDGPERIEPCGCKYWPTQGMIRRVESCLTHFITGHFGFFHDNMGDGHIECCDKPQMERLIEEYGRDEVAKAVEAAQDRRNLDGAYVRRVWEVCT